MRPVFTKTFFKFFFAFLLILGVASGILLFTASQMPPAVTGVDNIALPK